MRFVPTCCRFMVRISHTSASLFATLPPCIIGYQNWEYVRSSKLTLHESLQGPFPQLADRFTWSATSPNLGLGITQTHKKRMEQSIPQKRKRTSRMGELRRLEAVAMESRGRRLEAAAMRSRGRHSPSGRIDDEGGWTGATWTAKRSPSRAIRFFFLFSNGKWVR